MTNNRRSSTGPHAPAEERFRLVFEASPSAMIMVDGGGRMSLVNAQAEQLFGYQRSELIGQPIELLVPARYRSVHPGHRALFSENPTTRSMGAGRDLFGLRKDGSEMPIEIGLNPIKTDEGAFVLASIIDITERKRAEERFRLVVEAAPSAMLMVDDKGLVTLVNRQAEQLFGYDREELMGQAIETLVPERYRLRHPGHRDIFSQHPTARAMGAGRDLFGLRKDGSEVPIEIGLNPIKTDEGSFVLASIIDITERKRAEERFRLVVEAAPNAMLMVNEAGRITLVNKQAEELFGYSRQELLSQRIEMLVPERYRSAHPGHRALFSEHPTTRSMGAGRDLFGLRKDGSEVPIEIGLNPIKTDEGSFVLASVIDITERKRAEERFRLVVEAAPSAIIMVDRRGLITLVNTQTETLFGYSREEIVGQPVETLVPERYRTPHPNHRTGFFERPSARAMGVGRDLYGCRKDGTEMPIEIGLNPIKTDEGTFVLASIIDITERKRADNAVRQSEERLDFALQVSETGAWDLDLVDHTAYRSLQHDRIFGYDRLLPTWTYEMFLNHVLPEDREKVDRLFGGSIADKKDWDFQCRIRRDDGEIRWIWASGRHRLDERGVPRTMSGIVQDITERKEAEADLREKSEALASATQQLWQTSKLATMGELAASVAHELNNPLATISLRLESLATQLADDEEKTRAVDIVANEVERMGKLVGGLLQFSRRGHQQISTIDICEEIENSLELIEYHLRSHKIEMVRDFAASLPTVQADRQQLRQVFLNLMTNASDAMSEGGTLIVRATARAEGPVSGVQIELTDSGPGIAPGDLEKIWEPFFTTKAEGKGTGLGLAICRRVIEEHRGNISIESRLGEGTTIRIILPATNGPQKQ